MTARRPHSQFQSLLQRFLALKRALGRRYDGERRTLEGLNRFLLETRRADLDSKTFAAWCKTLQHLHPNTRRARMRMVRNLCLYRRRFDPSCFVPDSSQFPPKQPAFVPYIFSRRDIPRLLAATRFCQTTYLSPLCPQVFRLAITLLYTMGLRLGEVVRLKIGDYDRREQTLIVRASKFHRSRLLPLSTDAVRAVDRYLTARRRRNLPIMMETALLWHRSRRDGHYTAAGLGQGISRVYQMAGVRTATSSLPRVHDLRHTFAVHALLRWYRAGANVQAALPYLSIYMGHGTVASTLYYLPFVHELASHASERFALRCGSAIVLPDRSWRRNR